MKPSNYLGRIPGTLDQIDVLLRVPHFVAAGNREAAFHLRMALSLLIKAVRVHRGLAAYQTRALPDLVYGDGTSIEGLPASDRWRAHLEPFLALELPRSRVRDRHEVSAPPVPADAIRSASERLAVLLPLAMREIGGGVRLAAPATKGSSMAQTVPTSR